MSFTSWTFVVFLLVVYVSYRALPHKGQNLLLLAGSYVFYGWWDVRFLFLLVLSSVVYYTSGAMIHRGSLTRSERVAASLWVVVSAFSFVFVRWNGLDGTVSSPAGYGGLLLPSRTGGLVFVGICLLTLTANLLHARVSALEANTRRRLCLWVAIGANLSILALFKYSNFLIESAEGLLHGLGVVRGSLHLDLALPVGISFYTFQGMTYVIDIYRRRLAPVPRLLDFALFLAFFPLVLAGPIERAVRLLPQITGVRHPRPGQTARGFHLILQGLFKKVAIADGAARTVNAVFGAAAPASWIDALAGTFFFAVQLYCDFSGYSDMAVGIASLFGIELTTNFRYPYFSRNPADFWTRWHISLSSWFRDYVFFPLGGPYGTTLRWMRNVMLTFLVTGLWHGAGWNFVLWGLYHGCLLCLHRWKESLWKPPRASANPLAAPVSVVSFFLLTCYGWVLFRCQTLQQVVAFTSTLLLDVGNLHLTAPLPPVATLAGLPLLFIMELIEFLSGGKHLDEVLPVPVWTAFHAAMIFALILGAGAVSSQFVYFTF